MHRLRAGTRRRVEAVAVDGSASIRVPPRFAPNTENCEIEYTFSRGESLRDETVSLQITDKDDNNITSIDTIGNGPDRSDKFSWDGKDTEDNYVTPLQSPFTVTFKIGNVITRTAQFNVEVSMIQITVTGEPRIYMNDPEETVEAYVNIKLRMANGTHAVAGVPIQVKWSFQPNENNLTVNDSFEYDTTNNKKLGKKDDNTAVHWEAHPNSDAESDDRFKQTCKSQMVTEGEHRGKAFIRFKPSGVGGDIFSLKAEVFEADNTTVMIDVESRPFEVWRQIEFANVYSMHDETFLESATSHANIRPAFEPRAFVHYTRDSVNNLAESLSVRYIGLYISGGGTKNWPADLSPANLETSPNQLQPTAQELSRYAYTGSDATRVAQKNSAKTAIENKAQLWFNAIVDAYRQSVDDWFSDAGINDAQNSLLAVKYYHPKLSGLSDGATNFWPAGIQINLANPGSGRTDMGDPDQACWRCVLGFNRGRISVIFKNYSSNTQLIATCRHEIAHGTKSVFKRDIFGTGDHSSTGLMTAVSGASNFSNNDIRILRGWHR